MHGDLVMLQPVDEQLEARVARQRGALVVQSVRCGRAPRPAGSVRSPFATTTSRMRPRIRLLAALPFISRPTIHETTAGGWPAGRGSPSTPPQARRAADVTVRRDRPLQEPADGLRQLQQARIAQTRRARPSWRSAHRPAPLSSTMRRAEVDEDFGNVDLDRADLVAGAAERRRVGQRTRVLHDPAAAGSGWRRSDRCKSIHTRGRRSGGRPGTR